VKYKKSISLQQTSQNREPSLEQETQQGGKIFWRRDTDKFISDL